MSNMAYILGHQKFFQRLDDGRWDVTDPVRERFGEKNKNQEESLA